MFFIHYRAYFHNHSGTLFEMCCEKYARAIVVRLKRKSGTTPKREPYRFMSSESDSFPVFIQRKQPYASSAKYLMVRTIWLV